MRPIPVEYGRVDFKRPEASAAPSESGAPATAPKPPIDETPRAQPKRESKRRPDPAALATYVRATQRREHVEDETLDCEPWEHRSPVAVPDEHHSVEIVLNGCTLFQQPPPASVKRGRKPRARGKGAARSEQKADVGRLTAAVQLTPRARKVAALYDDEGLSYAQIAERLGLSVRQVERDLYQRRSGMRALVLREREAFE